MDEDKDDPYCLLDAKVDDLVNNIVIEYIAYSLGRDYEYRVFFEEEIIADTQESAISLMISKLIEKNNSYPEEINLKIQRTVKIPVFDPEYKIWELKDFTNVEFVKELSRHDVKKLPEWNEKVTKAKEEKDAAEKAKKEAEQKLWKEESRRRDLATYERIKKELENGNV